MVRENPTFMAGGNIVPSRFVKWNLGEDNTVIQATANAKIQGIAQEGSREAPIPSVSTVYAAQDGEEIHVYGQGEVCLLELGGTVAAADDLKSDANGKGVVVTAGTTTQEVGAQALQSGVSGEKIRVQVLLKAEGQTVISS